MAKPFGNIVDIEQEEASFVVSPREVFAGQPSAPSGQADSITFRNNSDALAILLFPDDPSPFAERVYRLESNKSVTLDLSSDAMQNHAYEYLVCCSSGGKWELAQASIPIIVVYPK